MSKRIVVLTSLLLSLSLLPGCPAGSSLVGAWIISFGGTDYGLQLNANGEAVPFMADALLGGTWTWEVEGDRVIFHQVSGSNRNIWAAEVVSDTELAGAWVGWAGASLGISNIFTAVKQ